MPTLPTCLPTVGDEGLQSGALRWTTEVPGLGTATLGGSAAVALQRLPVSSTPPKPHPPGRGRSGFCTKLLVKRQFPHRAAALAWNHLVMLQRTRGLEHESFTGLAFQVRLESDGSIRSMVNKPSAGKPLGRLSPARLRHAARRRAFTCLRPLPRYVHMPCSYVHTYTHGGTPLHIRVRKTYTPRCTYTKCRARPSSRPQALPGAALPCPARSPVQVPPSCCRFSQICQQAMWLILAPPPPPRPPRKGTTAASSSV